MQTARREEPPLRKSAPRGAAARILHTRLRGAAGDATSRPLPARAPASGSAALRFAGIHVIAEQGVLIAHREFAVGYDRMGQRFGVSDDSIAKRCFHVLAEPDLVRPSDLEGRRRLAEFWVRAPFSLNCTCSSGTLRRIETVTQSKTIEFFLRLHGLRNAHVNIPPPPDPTHHPSTPQKISSPSPPLEVISCQPA